MNKTRLLSLADHIEQQYDPGGIIKVFHFMYACKNGGAVGDIAGWAVAIFCPKEWQRYATVRDGDLQSVHVQATAAQALGLTPEEAAALFQGHWFKHWDTKRITKEHAVKALRELAS